MEAEEDSDLQRIIFFFFFSFNERFPMMQQGNERRLKFTGLLMLNRYRSPAKINDLELRK